MKSLNCCYRPV